MVAAEAAFAALTRGEKPSQSVLLSEYPEMLKKSWLWEELYAVRNIRPAWSKFGTLGGVFYAGTVPNLTLTVRSYTHLSFSDRP